MPREDSTFEDRWDDRSTAEPRAARDLRTKLAAESVELSNLFKIAFRGKNVEGVPPRRPTLVGTDGMSTGGGRQSRQNIVLQPIEGKEGVPLVVGWVDPAADMAELRSWRSVVDTYTERTGGRELALDNITYTAFVREAMGFLEAAGFRCTVTGRRSMPPQNPLEEGMGVKRLALLLVGVLLVGLVLGSAAMYFIFR